MAYGIRLHFPRYHAKDLFSLHQCRDRERKGVSRNIVDRFEATIVYLLLPARFIEVDHLDHFGIVESGNVRIVERDVCIFADAHEDDVSRKAHEQFRISAAFIHKVR